MSNLLGPNGTPLPRGVDLGGRALRLTVSREEEARLKIMASASGQPMHELANLFMQQAINLNWQDYLRARLVYLLSHWMSWGLTPQQT